MGNLLVVVANPDWGGRSGLCAICQCRWSGGRHSFEAWYTISRQFRRRGLRSSWGCKCWAERSFGGETADILYM